jgi:hypothetical protein
MSWIQGQLEYLATFPTTENWDSYGGLPTSPHARELAVRFLGWLSRKRFPKPHMGPTGDGGVEISWCDEVMWVDIRHDGAVVTSFLEDDEALGSSVVKTEPTPQIDPAKVNEAVEAGTAAITLLADAYYEAVGNAAVEKCVVVHDRHLEALQDATAAVIDRANEPTPLEIQRNALEAAAQAVCRGCREGLPFKNEHRITHVYPPFDFTCGALSVHKLIDELKDSAPADERRPMDSAGAESDIPQFGE